VSGEDERDTRREALGEWRADNGEPDSADVEYWGTWEDFLAEASQCRKESVQ